MPSKEVARAKGSGPHGANKEKVIDLLCQALQAELGRASVLDVAVRAAQHQSLREHLARSRVRSATRIKVLQEAFAELAIPAGLETPGRDAVRRIQETLLAAMEDNLVGTPLELAELITSDCVAIMESKTDGCWRLIGALADVLAGDRGRILRAACARVGTADDDLPVSAAWTHALWLKAIGLPTVLPPALGAARTATVRAGRAVRARQARS